MSSSQQPETIKVLRIQSNETERALETIDIPKLKQQEQSKPHFLRAHLKNRGED